MDIIVIFAAASLGAALQEVLYWYQIYKSLDFEKYDKLITSRKYWIIVSAFVVITGAVAIIWFADRASPAQLRDILVFGVSLPLIVKQIVKARPEQIRLGSGDAGYFDVR